MSGWFNPANPRFRRGVVLTSVVVCTLTTFQIVLADFGSQEHVLSPVQRIIIPKIDEFFGVTANDLKFDESTKEQQKKEFIKVVSPLMPTKQQQQQQQQQSIISNNNNEQKTTNSNNIVVDPNSRKNDKKKGWLW